MSAYRIVQRIEAEAIRRNRQGKDDAFELIVILRGGGEIRGPMFKSDSYFLRLDAYLRDSCGALTEDTLETFIPYEAIDAVTVKWL